MKNHRPNRGRMRDFWSQAFVVALLVGSWSVSIAVGQQCVDGPSRVSTCQETYMTSADCYIDDGSCKPESDYCNANCTNSGCSCYFNQYQCIMAPCPGSFQCVGDMTPCSNFDSKSFCEQEMGCLWSSATDDSTSAPATPSAPSPVAPPTGGGSSSSPPSAVPSPSPASDAPSSVPTPVALGGADGKGGNGTVAGGPTSNSLGRGTSGGAAQGCITPLQLSWMALPLLLWWT